MSSDFEMDVEDVRADDVKQKAREIGIDLVGIASAETVAENPPPGENDTDPDAVLRGAASIVILAQRMTGGAASVEWDNRGAHHTKELGLDELEQQALDLVYYLEDHGHPSIQLPAQVARSAQYDQMKEGPLSLPHLAVEAGLGTLGLNLQLLTPEFGPRVILSGIVTTADIEPDERMKEGLCEGAECGRCLLACPGDAIDHFGMRVEDCRPHAEPWGFEKFIEHGKKVLESDSFEEREELITGTDSLMLWQSMVHGSGAYTGCTRCYDVCPVGDDYHLIKETHEEIPEETDEKRERLSELRSAEIEGNLPNGFENHARWIGNIDFDHGGMGTSDGR